MDYQDPYEFLNSLIGPVRDKTLPPPEKWPDYSHLRPIIFATPSNITSQIITSVDQDQPSEQIDPDPCTDSFVSPKPNPEYIETAPRKLCPAF